MSQRSIRVNELLKREIALLLHTRFQDEAVTITITEVDVAPDLRTGKVYYSVIGDETDEYAAARFFGRHAKEIIYFVSKQVTLKYTPRLRYELDNGMERGARMMELLDELEQDET